MADLIGKVAMVIGGTRGIGRAISRRMVADGASVAMIYESRDDNADELRASLEGLGANVIAIRADVSRIEDLQNAFASVVQRFGHLDIVVAVAGTAVLGAIDTLLDVDFDRTFALNVRAPFIAARNAAQIMPNGGRIVFIGSIVADRSPGKGSVLYTASKAALQGMVRALARDLGERAITANLVQPGPTDTERNPADGPNAPNNRSPLAIPRHGTPEEVAGLVAYLVSAEAAFVTGSVYNIDGGWSA